MKSTKRLNKTVLFLIILFLPSSPATASTSLFESLQAISLPQLDNMRGGFVTQGGWKISLGIEKVVMVDGVLQTLNTLNIPDLSKLNNIGCGITSRDSQTGLATQILNNGFVTLIQNNLDQKRIQEITVIQADIYNGNIHRQMELASRINDQLVNALH